MKRLHVIFQLFLFAYLCIFSVHPLFSDENKDESGFNYHDYRPVLAPVEKKSVFPNDLLIINLKGYNQAGTQIDYSFSWTKSAGKIEQKSNKFMWIPTEEDIGMHPIIFTATDSTTKQTVSQPAIIIVKPIEYVPELSLEANKKIPDGFLTIDEQEDLAIVIHASDRNENERLILDYFIDGKRDQRIENARFEVTDRVATFLWTPTNEQVKRKTVALTFFVEDEKKQRTEKNINILLNDIDHKPVFQNITKEYFVDEDELLSFSVKATDDDNEQISYKIISTDIKQNDLYFDSIEGKFQWKPAFEYSHKQTKYTLIFSATDFQHTIFDTFFVKVDPRNYPPEIAVIRDKEIRENEELILRLAVKDKNGDEGLRVSVEQSDINDYEFDQEKRVFKWTPSYEYVNNIEKRTAYVKFLVSDGEFEDSKTAKIVVYDREDPNKVLNSYKKTLNLAHDLEKELAQLDRRVEYTVKRKYFWNKFFDVSTILVGAFIGVASSSIASDELQESAVPIGGAITSLIGVRSIVNKSTDKYTDLHTKLLGLIGSIKSSVNAMLRDYGEDPDSAVLDDMEFKNDFEKFKNKITEYETKKENYKAEYSALSIR